MSEARNLTHLCIGEFRAHRKWRQRAAPATSVDGRKRVRVLLTRIRGRVRQVRPPLPTVTSTAGTCPFHQCKKPRGEPGTVALSTSQKGVGRVALSTSQKGVGRAEESVVLEPWIAAIPMAPAPHWHDGNAGDVVDARQIVQRLPEPLDPPESPFNEILENDLRRLFDQMSKSGDVVFRIQAGAEPGLDHIECCNVLTQRAFVLLSEGAGDELWHLRIQRLVYKVLFEYIMKLYFGEGPRGAGRIVGPATVGEGAYVHKPGRPLLDMLMWLKEVAKGPSMLFMPGMSQEQEWQRWGNLNVTFCNQQNLARDCPYGIDLNQPPYEVRLQDNFTFFKKMAIGAREALFTKVQHVLPIKEFPNETSKKQKIHRHSSGTSSATATIFPDNMHTSLVDNSGSVNGSASSDEMLDQRKRRSLKALAFLKFKNSEEKNVPVGPAFQADVPKWKGPSCETHFSGDDEGPNDSTRSGTQVWPIKGDLEEAGLETTGKGRLDLCVCPSPRSASCVRYHINKSRLQLKSNLGQALNGPGLSDMGEEIASSWTLDEQRIFDALVKLNPVSENKSFLGPALMLFGSKTRRDIVCYYFNVFVLRRMGIQTRLIGADADSDDDDFNVDAYEDLHPRDFHKSHC